MTKIKIDFCILGERFSPDKITRLLNLNPSESYRKGAVFMGDQISKLP